MKCLLCGEEMEQGGIVAGGVVVSWVPLREFQKRGLRKLVYVDTKSIGHSDMILGQTQIPNAYYCRKCNKVMGIFDVNKQD